MDRETTAVHSHSPNPPSAARLTRRLLAVLVLTATFMVVEAIGGWLSGSLALLADAGHMLTDVGALTLTLVTARLAMRPADDRHTYGYRRWEIFAALVNGAALFAIAIWITIEAVHRVRDPVPVESGLMLAVAAAGLIVNAIALRLLHRSHGHSLNVRGAYLHVMGDLLGSAAAIVAAGIIATTGWTPADPILSVLVALLILGGAWRLLRDSTDVLLERAPRHMDVRDIERQLRGIPGVLAVHDLHIWSVTSGTIAMSGHVVVPDLPRHPDVLEAVRNAMGAVGISHVTVQLEVEEGCEGCG